MNPSSPLDDMKPTSDHLKQSALAALLEKARQYAPRSNLLCVVTHTPAQAVPGEVWLTQSNEGENGEAEEPLTVLLLDRFEGQTGEPTLFTSVPIFSEPGMASPTDAILPREILGFEAGIAFASAGSILSKSLAKCEGALPEEWITRLSAFYDYIRGRKETPPLGTVVGAPYIDENDPAFVFHENLTDQMHVIATPVLEWVAAAEPSAVPGWFSRAFDTLKERGVAASKSVSEMWEECRFPIPLPNLGFQMSSIGGVGLVGMAASGFMSSVPRPFWRLAVGDTGAVLLLEKCRTPADAFAVEVLTDPNNQIEGSDVLDTAGNIVATIAGGKSGAPFCLEANWMLLRLRDGTVVPLRDIPKAK
jgi:hypothetical protein